MRRINSFMVRTADVLNIGLWRLFPTINVDKVKDIPCDYPGAMGVPITFMSQYSPEQFEVIGITCNDKENLWGVKTKSYTIADAKNYTILNAASVLKKDGKLKATYARILVRRKQG